MLCTNKKFVDSVRQTKTPIPQNKLHFCQNAKKYASLLVICTQKESRAKDELLLLGLQKSKTTFTIHLSVSSSETFWSVTLNCRKQKKITLISREHIMLYIYFQISNWDQNCKSVHRRYQAAEYLYQLLTPFYPL